MNLSAAYLKKREEWKEEGKLEVAINLLREGATLDLIVRATGLPIETIESLRSRV
jgi:predicted HTH domain antitoxin